MLDRAELDQAADFIARHKTLRGAELARVVGEYILETFFDGDYEEFCRKSRSKPVRFRSLAARRDLGVSTGRLCLLVRISRQLRELPRQQADSLSLSHHRALLPLHDAGHKRRLADAAHRGRWSSHRLEQEVRRHLASCRVGRKPVDSFVKSVRQLRRSAVGVQRAASAPGTVARLDHAGIAELRETAELFRTVLADLTAVLED